MIDELSGPLGSSVRAAATASAEGVDIHPAGSGVESVTAAGPFDHGGCRASAQPRDLVAHGSDRLVRRIGRPQPLEQVVVRHRRAAVDGEGEEQAGAEPAHRRQFA